MLFRSHAAGIVGIPRYEIPPFRAKDGLLRWLKRVEATIGPSRLMQIAVIAVSHRDTTDWPLKDES